MTRKLRALSNADATTAESRAAALQYVRVVTGRVRPHPDDAADVERIVLELARATQRLTELTERRARLAEGVRSAV